MRLVAAVLAVWLTGCALQLDGIGGRGDATASRDAESGRSDAGGVERDASPPDGGTDHDAAPAPMDAARADAGIERLDAGIDAGMPPVDAGPSPTWMVLETLTIDCTSSTGTRSTNVLAAGRSYRLRASGLMMVTTTDVGDADYWDIPAAPKDLGTPIDLGLGVDDSTIDGDTRPNWGPYRSSHVYTIPWMGAGRTIHARYHDGRYSNNSGELTLEILELR